jgi:prepilin-type N-terminal cleavage/methylation domain-containing protein
MRDNHTITAARHGFSLVELLIAMTVLLIVIGASTRLFMSQSRAVAGQAGRLDAMQNARFSVNAIDRELRMIGAGVVDAQPMLVQASAYAIAFNSDLVSKTGAGVSAVYYDPDAPSAETVSLGKASKITLPLTGFGYPDTNYTQGSAPMDPPSAAETISYWFAPDPAPVTAGDYALFRRVNAGAVNVVARGLLFTAGEPVFRYFKADSMGALVEIASAQLPLHHSAKIHNSLADSANSAQTDSVLVVRVRLRGRYTDRNGSAIIRTSESSIRLMNAGLIRHSTCGETPVFGQALGAVASIVAGERLVTLTWNKASDEGAGEKDVEKYAVYKRLSGSVGFTEPFASIAAGLPNYSFTDIQVAQGEQWIYGVSAQDCTPANSSISSSVTVVIP